MKRIILCISLFVFFGSQAQQINPVPDYVFSNKMSVGRNAVTDTAAYFSIGPRYGAVRGFMPPMVTDTATITTGKRNGLTIFSIQKNKYMYWDSVRVQWSDFAGSSGAYIFASDTSSMLTPYIRAAGNGLTKSGQSLLVDTAAIATRARVQKAVDSLGAVKGSGTVTSVSAGTGMSFTTITSTGSVAADTTVLSTRAWRQKGIDSVAGLSRITGSGTTNRIMKFSASSAAENSGIVDSSSSIAMTINSSQNIGIGISSPVSILHLRANSANLTIDDSNDGTSKVSFRPSAANYAERSSIQVIYGSAEMRISAGASGGGYMQTFYANGSEGMRLSSSREFLVATTSDAGDYKLQVGGSIYNTTTAVFAASSGSLLVGATTNPDNFKIYAAGDIGTNTKVSTDIVNNYTGGATPLTIQTGGTQNIIFSTNTSEDMRIVASSGNLLVGTQTDGGHRLQVDGSTFITGAYYSGAPAGGSVKPWKLGEAATVSPTSPNRTIRVEIDGTVYYLHAKTTND